jgi:hypothetical protein
MVYARTAHNRTVYASPLVGDSGSILARSIASLIPTLKLHPQFASPGLATQAVLPC